MEPISEAREPLLVEGETSGAPGVLRGELGGTVAVRSRYLVILTVLALLAVCVMAKPVIVPIVSALILYGVLAPVVRFGRRHGIPASASAAVILVGLLAALSAIVHEFYQPAAEWLSEIPRNAAQLKERIGALAGSVEEVVRASEQVEDLANMGGNDGAVVVKEKAPSLLGLVLDRASQMAASLFVILTLLFLLLASERSLMLGTVRVLSRLKDRKRAVLIAKGFQRDISYYLWAITFINIALGLVIGLALWALGMPNPALWGVMACVLNYIPYVGMMIGALIVGFVALMSFDEPSYALLAPTCYAVLSSVEGGLVTPAILGRGLLVSPPLILIWLILWGWMWGIAGALLAVPMLMAVKIFCEHVPSFRGVALFLSRESEPEPRSSPLVTHFVVSAHATREALDPDGPPAGMG